MVEYSNWLPSGRPWLISARDRHFPLLHSVHTDWAAGGGGQREADCPCPSGAEVQNAQLCLHVSYTPLLCHVQSQCHLYVLSLSEERHHSALFFFQLTLSSFFLVRHHISLPFYRIGTNSYLQNPGPLLLPTKPVSSFPPFWPHSVSFFGSVVTFQCTVPAGQRWTHALDSSSSTTLHLPCP